MSKSKIKSPAKKTATKKYEGKIKFIKKRKGVTAFVLNKIYNVVSFTKDSALIRLPIGYNFLVDGEFLAKHFEVLSCKVSRTNVTMGVKGTKFRIIDHATDEVIHKSKSYSSNSNASRGGKRYCKRMGYVVKENI